MEGYVVYTDIGYENNYGELDGVLSNCMVYTTEEAAIRNAKEIWKHRKEYGIEEVGVTELYIKRYTKNPTLVERFK